MEFNVKHHDTNLKNTLDKEKQKIICRVLKATLSTFKIIHHMYICLCEGNMISSLTNHI